MISTDPVVQEVLGFTDVIAREFTIKAVICIIATAIIGLAVWFIVSKFKK